MANPIPHDSTLDATFALWNEGYEFIWNRCRRFQSDLFVTRLLGRTTICMHGRDAAALFYDDTKLRRRGALRRRILTSLFGKGSLQSPDSTDYRQRRAPLLALTETSSIQRLLDHMAAEWRSAIVRWQGLEQVVLFDETQRLLTRATCDWASVPLEAAELDERAHDFGLLVDAFDGGGPSLWRGHAARRRAECWITEIIEDVRRGTRRPRTDSALYVLSHLRAADGSLLPAEIAAMELLHVMRPAVALSWYITFAALALREQPRARERIAREPASMGPGEYARLFMQETRRYYPLTPYLGAKVRSSFQWRGQAFDKGTRVLLDVYGTNHDPALWDRPDEFRPERFKSWRYDPLSLLPRGGEDAAGAHRDPGEVITLHGLSLALHFLTRCATYRVPKQDLSYSLRRMPTRPKSGFVMSNVRATATLDTPTPGPSSERSNARLRESFNPAHAGAH